MEELRNLTLSEINEVLTESENSIVKRHWRKGQAFFNVLYAKYPEIADKLRGTEADPFYDDKKIADAILYLWKDVVEGENENNKPKEYAYTY